MRAVVRQPSPQRELPRAWTLLATAVLAAAFGFGMVRVTLTADIEAGASDGDPAPIPGGERDEDGEEEDEEDAPDAAGAPVDAADVPPSAPGGGPVASPVAPSGRRRLVPGRIAYLRCEGAALVDSPYPCPRDRALEDSVWEALETLSGCATAPPGTGAGDLRLHFSTLATVQLSMHPVRNALDSEAMLSCLRPGLASATTTVRSHDMLVSFRFELVDRGP